MQSGRSMIEMLGVLAIIGVLSVGGIVGYSKAMQKNRLNNTRNQISHIIANVKQYYINQGTYDGLTTETAVDAGIIPGNMTIEESNADRVEVKNEYNGSILVEATTDPLDGKPLFMVIMTGLPKDAAMDISTADWREADGLVQMDLVNGSVAGNEEDDDD